MTSFSPGFTISNRVTRGLTAIERARGFLEAATLSEDWVRRMSQRALLVEAHATTHIEECEDARHRVHAPPPGDVPPLMAELVQWLW